MFVHQDFTLAGQTHADFFQTKILGVGSSAGGAQNPFGRKLLLLITDESADNHAGTLAPHLVDPNRSFDA